MLPIRAWSYIDVHAAACVSRSDCTLRVRNANAEVDTPQPEHQEGKDEQSSVSVLAFFIILSHS
jgi:hypothetical protein